MCLEVYIQNNLRRSIIEGGTPSSIILQGKYAFPYDYVCFYILNTLPCVAKLHLPEHRKIFCFRHCKRSLAIYYYLYINDSHANCWGNMLASRNIRNINHGVFIELIKHATFINYFFCGV